MVVFKNEVLGLTRIFNVIINIFEFISNIILKYANELHLNL